jgi:cytochrome P450
MASPAGTEHPTLEGFDPTQSSFFQDPYPMFERARREQPVFFYPDGPFWVVTGYEDTERVITDFATFSNHAFRLLEPPAEFADRVPANIADWFEINNDPPEHTVSRKVLQSAFTRGLVRAQEESAARTAGELIDAFIDDGHCDLTTQYASPLGLSVMVNLVGLPKEDSALYTRWSEALFALLAHRPWKAELDPDHQPGHAFSAEYIRESWSLLAEEFDYLRAIVDERARSPRDDLISRFLEVCDESGRPVYGRDRIVTEMAILIEGGMETNATLMAQTILHLSRHPDQLAQIKRDRSLVPHAVEEALRLRGSTWGIWRIAREDVEVGGVTIPEGALILAMLASAAHDEKVFECPHQFDVHRANTGEHLSWGKGRHFCPGAPLAKMTNAISLNTILDRIPDIRVPEQRLEYREYLVTQQLMHLRCEWDV